MDLLAPCHVCSGVWASGKGCLESASLRRRRALRFDLEGSDDTNCQHADVLGGCITKRGPFVNAALPGRVATRLMGQAFPLPRDTIPNANALARCHKCSEGCKEIEPEATLNGLTIGLTCEDAAKA